MQTTAGTPCSEQMVMEQPVTDAARTCFIATSSLTQIHQSSTYHDVFRKMGL